MASRRSVPSGHVATTTTTQKWGSLFCLPFPRQPLKCAVFGCHKWEIYRCHQHLILDELARVPFDRDGADRRSASSASVLRAPTLVVTTNLPFPRCSEVFLAPTATGASTRALSQHTAVDGTSTRPRTTPLTGSRRAVRRGRSATGLQIPGCRGDVPQRRLTPVCPLRYPIPQPCITRWGVPLRRCSPNSHNPLWCRSSSIPFRTAASACLAHTSPTPSLPFLEGHGQLAP